MKLWRIVVDIREADTAYAYPVVRHTFYGKTQAEASQYFRAHMKSDAFMRGCVNTGRFANAVTCRATVRLYPPTDAKR